MRRLIDIQEAKKIRLSKNFTLDEFLKSDTALRKGIDNRLPEDYLPRIQDLVDNVLQPLRDKFGSIKITSGYRSKELCVAIGSSIHSNHAYGFAADIEPYDKRVPLLDLVAYVDTNLMYKELIAEYFPDGWVHVAYQKDNNKQELKLKDREHNYTKVSLHELEELYNNGKL